MNKTLQLDKFNLIVRPTTSQGKTVVLCEEGTFTALLMIAGLDSPIALDYMFDDLVVVINLNVKFRLEDIVYFI